MPEPDKAIFSYIDQAGKRSTSTMYFATGLTLPQIQEGLAAIALLIDNCVGALIMGVDAVIPVDISGLTGNTAGVTSDVEEVGEFLSLASGGRKVITNIPAIKDNLSEEGSDNLDQSNVDISAIITMLEDGIVTSGGPVTPCDIGSLDITETATARERVRNSGARS